MTRRLESCEVALTGSCRQLERLLRCNGLPLRTQSRSAQAMLRTTSAACRRRCRKLRKPCSGHIGSVYRNPTMPMPMLVYPLSAAVDTPSQFQPTSFSPEKGSGRAAAGRDIYRAKSHNAVHPECLGFWPGDQAEVHHETKGHLVGNGKGQGRRSQAVQRVFFLGTRHRVLLPLQPLSRQHRCLKAK